MSFKKKLIILAVVALLVTLSVFTVVAETANDENGDGDTGLVTIAMEDGATLTVNKENLNFTLAKGNRTWYSGNRNEQDGLKPNLYTRITDAVTVGFRSLNTGNSDVDAISRLNTTVKFIQKANGFDARIRCGKISIVFNLQLRYENGKITVTVPFDSIAENGQYRLAYLNIYPYFDSSYGLTDGGSIIIPDGSGAVIDLSKATDAKRAYSARVYGSDYGISASTVKPTSPLTATMPLLALTYKDGGSVIVAESGDDYCTVNARVAGITTDYNLAYFSYIYREQYVKYLDSSGTGGKSILTYQEEPNKFDIVQTMTLLEGESNVADVANVYREILQLQTAAQQAGLRLQFLMAENKQGMFGKEVIAMTTVDYVKQVANQVSAYCDNLQISLLGYTSGGLDGSYPKHFGVETKTGSKRDYKALASDLASKGVTINYVTDFVKSYSNADVNRYDLALNLSRQYLTVGDTRFGSESTFRLMDPAVAMKNLLKDYKTILSYGGSIELQSIGNMLYSNYSDDQVSRSDTRKLFVDTVGQLQSKVSIAKPNAYLFGVCDVAYDVDITASNYIIETSSIPLLQMVIAGSVAMYSTPLNLNYTGEELILNLIDYNVYPSFVLTEQEAIELNMTNSAGIFTSSYTVWKDDIQAIYNQVHGILCQVDGQYVVSRVVVDGVAQTTYSNGKTVVVNYTNQSVNIDGNVVQALSAIVF